MLNIIEYNSAEAVTMDGVNWDIYARNSALVKDLEQSQQTVHRIQTSEIRYGRWTKKNGLQRGPTIDSDDFKEMEATGNIVYQYLTQHYMDIPFPYKDNYELWLLDQNRQPLALLNSVIYQGDIDFEQNINWTSGIAYKDSFKLNKIKNNKNNENDLNSAEQINQIINSYSNNSAQWFLRTEDGSGVGLNGINVVSELIDRKLIKNSFPALLINVDLFTNTEQQFIQNYYSWLAPWLLVMHCFSDEQRKILEQQAKINALMIEKQYRLYPKVIDQTIIKSALVETLIRSNQQQITEQVESVEYLELNNPTHHLNK